MYQYSLRISGANPTTGVINHPTGGERIHQTANDFQAKNNHIEKSPTKA